ncbi:MAG: peptidylprolyl isomerase [Proteobacteria bacterium]|nr:peptidylprolyl isomerase [Pseudomonadota bacterium]
MKGLMIVLIVMSIALLIASINSAAQEKADWKQIPGVYVVFDTTMGKIVCKLFGDEAPKTVDNFIGLAEGTKEFIDPVTGKNMKRPFYDGLVFHRVIPKFMIQGGDPTGTGRGGPGYKFEDEFHHLLRFDKPGKLAMANSGPNTNGSQFFITTVPTPWLDGRHSIFGQVVEGQEVLEKISNAEKDARDRPLKDIVIKKLTIKKILK